MATLIQTIRSYQRPFTTIVILPSNLLVQTYKEFLSFGIPDKDISMWGGDNEFSKSPIILASAEILKSNLIVFSERNPIPMYKEWKTKDSNGTYADYLKAHTEKERMRKATWKKRGKAILEQLADIELVLMDEVHGLRRNNVINDVLSLFHTRHRFGFTGTMPPELLDQWNIIGNIGPIILDVDSAALRSMDYISQVKAQIIKLHYKNPPRFKLNEDDQSSAYNEECEFLYHNQFRNKVIAHLANKFSNNSLILVDKIEHGETLERILKEQTKKTIFFIRGSVEMDEREKLRALMEKDDNIVCIAMSRIFAVGVNIKNLHYVLFVQGGKAKVTLIQSIGRGLRKHESKECLVLIDLADATHYGERHLAERIKYYGEEQINYEQKELFE
jgi:superfamily II DNA or RNA helicase